MKQIIKNIHFVLFLWGKIGIIGLNGSGKSTVMKIIAGLDQAYQGDVVFLKIYSVGYLPQEPELDLNKSVKEIVMEGVQETVDILKEYEEINNSFMDEEILNNPDKMEKLIARQGEVQDKIDAMDAWELDNKLRRAMDALRCPLMIKRLKPYQEVKKDRLLCRLLLKNRMFYYWMSPPTIWMLNPLIGLSNISAVQRNSEGAVTHDRYFLDNVAGWILELDRGKVFLGKGIIPLG